MAYFVTCKWKDNWIPVIVYVESMFNFSVFHFNILCMRHLWPQTFKAAIQSLWVDLIPMNTSTSTIKATGRTRRATQSFLNRDEQNGQNKRLNKYLSWYFLYSKGYDGLLDIEILRHQCLLFRTSLLIKSARCTFISASNLAILVIICVDVSIKIFKHTIPLHIVMFQNFLF